MAPERLREWGRSLAWVRQPTIRAALVAAAVMTGETAMAESTRLDSDPRVPSLKLDGRLHLQHDSFDGVYSDDGARRTATYSRRARLGMSGRLSEKLKYVVDVDFKPGGDATLRTAALAWGGLPVGTVRAGRFDPDFGLEQAISSNWTTGIERSAIWDLAAEVADIGEGHGVQLDHAGRRLYGSLGAFRRIGSRGVVARAVFTPVVTDRRMIHLGVSLADERLDGDDGRIRTRLGVRGVTEHADGHRVTLARSLAGGAAFGAHRLIGFEAAAAAGAFSVQAEAVQRRLSGGAPARVARGHYVQLAWTLTGEPRPYEIDGAKFGRIAPAHPRRGAWELFYRHDRLGVQGEPGLLGGTRDRSRAQAHVVGVNWYASRWLRWSANAVRGRTDQIVNPAGNAIGDAFSLRLQVVF